MHEDLELKVLSTLIAHLQLSLQRGLCQSDTVDKSKFVRPSFAELLAQHGMRQAEVQLHSLVALAISRLGGGLAQVFPVRVTGEAMLRKGGGGVVFRRRAEYLSITKID